MTRTRLVDVPLPVGGINEGANYARQPGWQPMDKVAPTAVDLRNVRVHGPSTDRMRIEQREGLAKYLTPRHTGGNPYQLITHIVTSDTSALSSTGVINRTITRVAVANGNIRTFDGSSFTTLTGGTGALSSSAPVIQAAPMLGKLYFADGTAYVKYTPGGSVETWTASAGDLPSSGDNKCRLIVPWAGRLVLSGLQGDGQNWFMSRQFAPLDFDYNPDPTDATQAVAGNNSDAGYLEDIVNTMIPYSDDRLIFGLDSSIHMLDGNPVAGGRIVKISGVTGMAYGNSWTLDPSGLVWFAGSRGGLYVMAQNSMPEEVTAGALKRRLRDIDYGKTHVQLAYDWEQHAIRMYITPLDGSATEHLFFDIRAGAVLVDKYTESADKNPTAVHVFDGDEASDRVVLLGCQDGYIRYPSLTAKNDDDDPIKSYCKIGPIQNGAGNKVAIRETQIVAGENTDTEGLHWEAFTGASAEEAAVSTQPVMTGVADPGRAITNYQRCKGHAVYYNLFNNDLDETWSLERLSVGLGVLGKAEQRRPY